MMFIIFLLIETNKVKSAGFVVYTFRKNSRVLLGLGFFILLRTV